MLKYAIDILEKTGQTEAMEAFDKETLSDIALRRQGEPNEVAGLICFLLSDDASYITGNGISIDGGWHC